MMRIICLIAALMLSPAVVAAELAGVFLEDRIVADNGDALVLNGMGLREKLWVDVYVGALYLAKKSDNVTEILAAPSANRIQMDFIYKEVASEKLLKAWREGFEKNQSNETLAQLKDRIEQFYSYFEQNALARDRYRLDYLPGTGTRISKNNVLLGVIPGEDFKNALLEIWIGNFPADKQLKRGMLGLR